MTEEPRRRALLLTPVVPDPQGVGLVRRAWSWAACLAAQYELEILVVSREPPRAAPRNLPGALRVIAISGPPLAPRGLTDWIEPDADAAEALSAMTGPPPDRVVVFRFYLHDVAALLPADWRARAEIDCDDWEGATRLSLAGLALRRGRLKAAWVWFAQALRYFRLERRWLRSYRAVHLTAGEDVGPLRRWMGLHDVRVHPNRIARPPGLAPEAPPEGSRTLLFVGALFYPPNEDALRWFGATVLPLLRRRVPDVRIVAAGRALGGLQRKLARYGIEYAHAPDDLRPLYADAAAVIAPLRGGGGAKFKVLEAWLHERALVATSHATRGLAAEAGRHFLLADRPEDFAEACAAVLNDRLLAARLAHEGRDLLGRSYLIDGAKA